MLSLFFKKGIKPIRPLNMLFARFVFKLLGIELKNSSFSFSLSILFIEEYYKLARILFFNNNGSLDFSQNSSII